MAVFIVTGYDWYECPEHGPWAHATHSGSSQRDSLGCRWAAYDHWGNIQGKRCEKRSVFIRHSDR